MGKHRDQLFIPLMYIKSVKNFFEMLYKAAKVLPWFIKTKPVVHCWSALFSVVNSTKTKDLATPTKCEHLEIHQESGTMQ